MFEKSLYDLIRGLRTHKGNERAYIQNSLRECRNEIRSSDMDLKATALLKLVYLEMFGHDMSWAAFHVLEVMSSGKYPQKRVGYLSAVQSFRPDTEVLMLATNMLKKDVTSVSIPTIALPLITIPHIITPSLALSLLSDLLPRLSHSSPGIRKKTIVTLYRLALTYPEALRPAWPKIKDMLMDNDEDPSVTAAAINVVCELGWRRPKDFLPLAPRLFDLLVSGGNNWMAIKIIKLFATLTPLEPRLIKKLLPPLTNLIRTTPAMSLLYECISGIIQGGILDGSDSYRERDDVAELCVSKLRGMIAVEGDPNLKYVALLAFNRIVISHPQLVAQHQDVILACIDDPDISIRLQALQLGSGMITSDNLHLIVDRLLKQLQEARRPDEDTGPLQLKTIEPAADLDEEDPEEVLQREERRSREAQTLPTEFRVAMIRQILEMCSRNTYANITDFEWYIETLVELVRVLPSQSNGSFSSNDVAAAVGTELRTVAVRVVSARSYATQTATVLLLNRETLAAIPGSGLASLEVLEYAAWIVGEYISTLDDPSRALDALLLLPKSTLRSEVICAYLQATIKVLSFVFASERHAWSSRTQAKTSLILARTVQFIDRFIDHPSLEVQERAVGFLELIRLAQDAVDGHDQDSTTSPTLISEVLPSLFNGQELNPVASSAQRKVPKPDNIDLSIPINESLGQLLQEADNDALTEAEVNPTKIYYYQKPEPTITVARPAIETIPNVELSTSYQNESNYGADNATQSLRKAERRERNRDDPFYIPSNENSGRNTPLHDILRNTNGHELEIDSIPIMELDTGNAHISRPETNIPQPRTRQPIQLVAEETFAGDTSVTSPQSKGKFPSDLGLKRNKKQLLQVDSSNIGNLSLTGEDEQGSETGGIVDVEMAKALANVERLRMEMQRDAERVSVTGDGEAGGTVVRKKKKKKAPVVDSQESAEVVEQAEATVVKKKKKKKTPAIEGEEQGQLDDQPEAAVVKRKKKKKPKETAEVEEL